MKDTNKKEFIAIIVIILVVILIIFTAPILQKLTIINRYSKALDEFNNSANYYKKNVMYEDGSIITNEAYKKENEILMKFDIHNNNLVFYKNIDTREMICTKNNQQEKVALVGWNTEMIMPEIKQYNVLKSNETESNFQLALKIKKISSDRVNGKECYFIQTSGNQKIWIDKETHLLIRIIQDNSNGFSAVTDYTYQKDRSIENDTIKPDLTGYTIQKIEPKH